MHQLSPAQRGPAHLLAERLRRDSASPLVTYYDEGSGERAELSAASLANWVAKTYYLLTDEVLTDPGDRAVVRLPMHWQRYVVLLGVWTAGLTVAGEGPARVAFGHDPAELAALGEVAEDVFALALGPWGNGYHTAPPTGTTDFVAAVRPQPDQYAQIGRPAEPGIPSRPGIDPAAELDQAHARATALGLGESGRLLIRDDRGDPLDISTWLAPLAVGGSVVLLRGATDAAAERIAAAERATAVT